MGRYRSVRGSLSGHGCCFDVSVVDTKEKVLDGDGKVMKDDGKVVYRTVCECFDKKDAKLICDALNSYMKDRK